MHEKFFILVGYLVAVNVVTFALFGYDNGALNMTGGASARVRF